MTDRETLQSVESSLESVLEIVRAQLATNVISVPQNPAPSAAAVTPPPGTPASHMDPFSLSILTAGYGNQPAQTVTTAPSDYLFTDYDFANLASPRVFDNAHDRHAVTPTRDVQFNLHVGKVSGNVPDFVAVSVADPNGSVARYDRLPVNAEGVVFSFDGKANITYTLIVISPDPFAVEIRLEAVG